MYNYCKIPVGVLLHYENKLDEILEHLMKFVPTVHEEKDIPIPGGSEKIDDTIFHKLLLGGDQLTAARICGTQALRVTQDKAIDRLEGQLQRTGMQE